MSKDMAADGFPPISSLEHSAGIGLDLIGVEYDDVELFGDRLKLVEVVPEFRLALLEFATALVVDTPLVVISKLLLTLQYVFAGSVSNEHGLTHQ